MESFLCLQEPSEGEVSIPEMRVSLAEVGPQMRIYRQEGKLCIRTKQKSFIN